MLAILIAIIAICLIFILLHLRPLTEDEINSLAVKKRSKNIRRYYYFDVREYNANKDFKKSMNPNGTFYYINENLHEFPSLAAALLKYKKHEWVIIAFEKCKIITQIWLNKGNDKTEVGLNLPVSNILKIAKVNAHNSVIRFHNHPNSNPDRYIYNKPSSQDLLSAGKLSKTFNDQGINFLDFVCERGKHYEYYLSASNKFMPLEEYLSDINKINGSSRIDNLKLHIERIF
jgi:hypothetical protein